LKHLIPYNKSKNLRFTKEVKISKEFTKGLEGVTKDKIKERILKRTFSNYSK